LYNITHIFRKSITLLLCNFGSPFLFKGINPKNTKEVLIFTAFYSITSGVKNILKGK